MDYDPRQEVVAVPPLPIVTLNRDLQSIFSSFDSRSQLAMSLSKWIMIHDRRSNSFPSPIVTPSRNLQSIFLFSILDYDYDPRREERTGSPSPHRDSQS